LRSIAERFGGTFKKYAVAENKSHVIRFVPNYNARQVFSCEEEMPAEYLITATNRNYGLSRLMTRSRLAYEFAVANHKQIPEAWTRDCTAGEKWPILCYLKRHENLVIRTPEATIV
jgi:hypothetical protein